MTTAARQRAEGSSEVLDVLVVGGGPGGTAAAFRARELDLSALVIDYDDLMKRIRDYSKDKLILPGFGGGDAIRFPRGGDLVASLVFDDVDKDDLCAAWKGGYRRFGVPFEVGVELLGVERGEGGVWRARAWDHGARAEVSYRARSLVLALGRGVPRRFDIPGDTEGIAYRLSDPEDYVGAPACVIGGGTSAAEAVIAISNAKAAAGDPCGIYWSYRGDRMPRVSRALAEVFFEAYVGNGNIRYYPKSEPAAVVTGFDREEYLAIRVDRRIMDGRPHEASLLEFRKERCVACIGEDLPEQLLASMGIYLVTGGPQAKKRMVVNRCLESRQPGVYVIGDLLSQAYFEADDFDGDPAAFREIRHRGNIKSALCDGVRVAQIIRQRLDGATEIDVDIEEMEEDRPAPPARVAPPRPARDGPPEASLAPGRAVTEAEATLIRVLPTGVEGEEYPVRRHGVTTIGRADCDLTFPNDSMLAPRHCSVSHTEDGYFLRDDGSDTGLFLRVPPARKRVLAPGALLRIGRQFLRVSAERGGYALTHYDRHGNEVGRHPIGKRVTIVGRESPDLTLAAGDGTLSRRHLALSVEDGALHVKDLKSVNGTYLRVRAALELEHGDQFRAGQQILTFSRDREQALDAGHAPAPRAVAAAAVEEAPVPPPGAGATVTLRGSGETLTLRPNETVCEALERHGIAIVAECHAGICGSDPVRVHSGRASALSEPGAEERETLEDLCELEPGPCRLACMLRLKGPAEIEVL